LSCINWIAAFPAGFIHSKILFWLPKGFGKKVLIGILDTRQEEWMAMEK